MTDQNACELCGRVLSASFEGSVCPMCREEFEELKAKQDKQPVAEMERVEAGPDSDDDNTYVSIVTASKTVGPAPEPSSDMAQEKGSTSHPAKPQKLSRKASCVIWCIVSVFAFFIFMSVITVIEEEAFTAARRAESTMTTHTQPVDRLTVGSTVELRGQNVQPGTQVWQDGVLVFDEERWLYMAYRQRDNLADDAETEEFIDQIFNHGHGIRVESGSKARVLDRSWGYHGDPYRREDAPCKVEILEGKYKGRVLWAIPYCCW